MGGFGKRQTESETAWIKELADWFQRRGLSPIDTANRSAYFAGFMLGMAVEAETPRAQLNDPRVQALVTAAQNAIAGAFAAGQFSMRASQGRLTPEDIRAAQEQIDNPGKH